MEGFFGDGFGLTFVLWPPGLFGVDVDVAIISDAKNKKNKKTKDKMEREDDCRYAIWRLGTLSISKRDCRKSALILVSLRPISKVKCSQSFYSTF